MATKYGIKVTGPDSITKINGKIRGQISKAKSKARLQKLVRESMYLYTLSFSPSFKKAVTGKVLTTRTRAKTQYNVTAVKANKKRKALKISGSFDTKIN